MDIHKLHNISWCGKTLTLEERAGVESAMIKRRVEEALPNIYLWGKIDGIDADYLIFYSVASGDDYPVKSWYFCTSKLFELQAFPDMTPEFVEKARAQSGKFKGDPAYLFGEDEDEEEEEEDEDEEEGAPKKVKPIKFSEMHRLADTVATIDHETAVVPKGAYIVTATHQVVENRGFAGLAPSDATSLSNLFHFRDPVNYRGKSVLERKSMIQSTEFLDPLSEDSPAGIWALRSDLERGEVTCRSLIWPGYFFYHKLSTPDFGGIYFGDGQRNTDIGFML